MNAGLTETQENLLDSVARPSKRDILRKMLVGANQNENDREIRRIEKILLEARDDIKVVKEKTGLIENVTHLWASLFKTGGETAKKIYPPK